ncbi:polysaccharide lyase family protein [Melissococcus plutonius]|uniref:polysaccharide lyase family protein n=1 Tax=Melissococcus plutonius TaxID=33970 RepID=UPI00065E66A7|nr:polysaccharide lyase family protein [Melissococcus plutonius]KMT41163.1 rhamnogalacturonate lyase RhiE [Melissococcus plutonius]
MKLEVQGLNCFLENKQLQVSFSQNGTVHSLKYQGKELLGNLDGAKNDPNKKSSFYCDYHDGKPRNLQPTQLKIIENSDHCLHIAYLDLTSPLNLEYHIFLLNDEACIYGYIVAKTTEQEMTIGELRTVYRLNHSLFPIAYTSERQGIQPKASYLAKFKQLQDETFELPDGSKYTNSSVYSKYDYAGYFKDNNFWGQYGDQFGCWFIPIDQSYFPSGPLKQDLLVHYDGIILNYLTGAHFGTGNFQLPKHWEKFYGPWCIYLNQGEQKISDVKNKVNQLTKKQDSSWFSKIEPRYPNFLVELTGELNLTGKENANDWIVILTDTKGDVYTQKAGRIFYTETHKDNHFHIPHIHPGIYHLYAYIKGTEISEDFYLGSFKLTKNEDLGQLDIPYQMKKLIWKIGYFSKTTEPFKFSDQLRNYIWKELVPNSLTYHVGSSEDWYYLQNDHGKWQIKFSKPEKLNKKFLLTICLAGATQKQMEPATGVQFFVSLNGHLLKKYSFENDRSAYRSTVTNGKSHKLELVIDAAQLTNINVIDFETDGHILYDMIKFEEENN